MEQFSLEKYLKNPSRKVVTRRGNPVRILCTDCGVMMSHPILTEIVCSGNAKVLEYHYIDGTTQNKNNDLFFADEKEELTEFEKAVRNILARYISNIDCFPETIKSEAESLLDLARKELKPEIDKEIDKAYKNIDTIVYNNGYKQGQYEIMEDLPKWKKAEKDEELDCHVAIQQDGRVVLSDFVQKDEYYITLDVLKTLPKEE